MRRHILILAFVVGAITLPHLANTAAAGQVSTDQADQYVRQFYLTHVSAQVVQARLLQLSGQTSTKLDVSINTNNNSVTVRTTEPALKISEALIRSLDVPATSAPPAGQATAKPAPTPPSAPPAPPTTPRAPYLSIAGVQPVPPATNIRLTLAITDSFTGQPVTKEMSVLMAQNSGGMIRTSGQSGLMNVDALAVAYQNGVVSVKLTFDYQASPPKEGPLAGVRPSAIGESLTVVLQDGKPLTVSETADPGSDRRVTVTLTAAILK